MEYSKRKKATSKAQISLELWCNNQRSRLETGFVRYKKLGPLLKWTDVSVG
jgi:hypothetical protein